MPRLPPLPDLDFAELAPHSREHGDVYFSGDGLSEKREVFLRGCGLPESWAGRELFVVGELGFGTGLNLLALWELWRRHRSSPTARLHLVSFEGALIPRDHAAYIHSAWPELAELSEILRANWPDRAYGMQRIALTDGVTLTLAIGDVTETLPQARMQADAWFLDGFAPAKNPAMWTPEVLGHVARLSAPGARAATYTVAGHVRRTLSELGFAVEKVAGHGRKKERLGARLISARVALPAPPQRVAITGAGVAGAWAARAFLDRGCTVDVYDRAAAPASGASGNPLALVMPRLDAADGPTARALIAAWLFARRAWARVGDAAEMVSVGHLSRSPREEQRFVKIAADPPLDENLLLARPESLLHIGAMAIDPARALPRLMDGAAFHGGREISPGDELDADLIVVCAGMGAMGFGAPPLEGRLGQVDFCADDGPAFAVADGGYAVRAFGRLVFGATFEAADGEPRVSKAARAHNLDVLERLRPGFTPGELTSRAAIRATTQDRFPFAGAPQNAELEKEKAPDGTPAPSGRLRLIGGLGSRGFLWAPLLAEMVASEACGEPCPGEERVAACLDPKRFHERALRRGN
jgi:tRNA 5-methylaminomethyl-2-thiouridine biosynthesis bifunctional protein